MTAIVLGCAAGIVALAVHEPWQLVGGFRFAFYGLGPLRVERACSGRLRVQLGGVRPLVGSVIRRGLAMRDGSIFEGPLT